MRRILIVPLFLLIVLPAFAAEDSSRVFPLAEKVVTGNLFRNSLQQLPVAVHVLDSAAIASSSGISVADVIKHEAGIAVRSYGGRGALQSVSMRGMSADYTLVLVDGQRYTTHQIGTVDLGIFSLASVERIEIVKGGSSSLYGADAIGGVINIVTKKGTQKKYTTAGYSTGSFGYHSFSLAAGGDAEGIAVDAEGRVEYGKNDFDLRYDDGLIDTVLKRSGADFRISTFSFSATSTSGHSVTALSFRLAGADRGQPKAITSPVQWNSARIADNDAVIQLRSEWTVSESFSVNGSVAHRYNYETYNDPTLIVQGKPLSSFYDNTLTNTAAGFLYQWSPEHRIYSGFEAGYGRIRSNEVRPANRTIFGQYVSTQHHFSNGIDLLIFPSVRYDSYSDVGNDISPKLGLNAALEFFPALRFRASYGKNFRAPTFNDLYWNAGGNARILPERLLSGDAGVSIVAETSGRIEIACDYFSIKTRDKIVWTPGASNIWTPMNVSAVSSTGIEFRGTGSFFDDRLRFGYHHTVMNVIKTSADQPNDRTQGKRLRYTPGETVSISAGVTVQDFSCSAVYAYTGFRYIQSDNHPNFILPSFRTVDLKISYVLQLGIASLRCSAEANNIGNEEYSLIKGYPMPLRNYAFSTNLHLQ